MNRAVLNLLIDSIAAVILTALVATGYVLWFALPPGTNRTHELLGWLRHEWGELHFWLAAVLLAVLAVHVALHWRWLSMGLCKRLGLGSTVEGRPWLATVLALLIAVMPLLATIVIAHAAVRPLSAPLHPLRAEGDRLAATEVLPDASDGAVGTSEQRESGAAARAGDGDTGPDSDPINAPARGGTGLPFIEVERRVARLLADRCADCHGSRHAAEGVRADTVAWLLIEQHGTRWVQPGDAARSALFRVVSRAAREPSAGRSLRRHELSSSDFELLWSWVEAIKP
ncbi:MAG: DUF4405 domain-containing protein [Phycisphaeraceae bacterium]|nr:DUF4405 domain-containing protein [Phycisphaeraceae bacterium]